MRKFLSIIAAIGLTTTASTAVVSCGNIKKEKTYTFENASSISSDVWNKLSKDQITYVIGSMPGEEKTTPDPEPGTGGEDGSGSTPEVETKTGDESNEPVFNGQAAIDFVDKNLKDILKQNLTVVFKNGDDFETDNFVLDHESIKLLNEDENSIRVNFKVKQTVGEGSSSYDVSSDELSVIVMDKGTAEYMNPKPSTTEKEEEQNKDDGYKIEYSETMLVKLVNITQFIKDNTGNDASVNNGELETLVTNSQMSGFMDRFAEDYIKAYKAKNENDKREEIKYLPGVDKNNNRYGSIEEEFANPFVGNKKVNDDARLEVYRRVYEQLFTIANSIGDRDVKNTDISNINIIAINFSFTYTNRLSSEKGE